MPPREIREYACPLLQPPINRLFVPRPIPEYVRAQDRDPEERTGTKFGPVASFMEALKAASQEESLNEELSPKILKQKKLDAKKRALQEKIETELSSWNPKELAGEEITGDPFKTIFVGGLNYSVTERQLKREFERFGEIKKISIVKEKETGKPKGYAFIEFEREKDVKIAFMDGDGMKIEGKRVLVDIERGRTVSTFRPRRLGGGLGTTRLGPKHLNQKYPGRDPRARISGSEPKRARSRSRSRERPQRDNRNRY